MHSLLTTIPSTEHTPLGPLTHLELLLWGASDLWGCGIADGLGVLSTTRRDVLFCIGGHIPITCVKGHDEAGVLGWLLLKNMGLLISGL